MAALEASLLAVPIAAPLTEDILEQLDRIRARFKLVASLLGGRNPPVYDPAQLIAMKERSF